MKKLSLIEINSALKTMENWHYHEGKILKEFRFANFPTAVLFINKLVDPAEEMDHHPDISLNYNRVTLSLFTHDAGALTDKDIALAKRIDALNQ